jgi:hypothetical protein
VLAAYGITALLFMAGLLLSGPVVAGRQSAFDIFPHLVALREFTDGRTPYTDAVMEEIQRGYYGRLAEAGEDLHRVSYPAYAYVLLAPLRPLEIPAAIQLWMALQLPAAFAALCLWAMLEKRLTPGWLIVCLALAFAYRYTITIFLNAQFNALLLAVYSAGLLLLARRRDSWAGGVMAVAALQPTLMGPLGMLQLGGLALRGRWRGLAVWAGVLLALTAISVLVIGWWIPDWLHALGGYASYQRHLTWVPERFGVVWAAVGLVCIAIPLLRKVSLADSYALTVVGLLLLLPQTGVYYLIALLPIVLVALQRSERQTRMRRWLVIGLAFVFLIASWGVMALDFEAAKAESLLMPLATLGILAVASWPTSRPASSSPSGAATAETPPGRP